MISKEKGRVIVSMKKSTIAKLDKICKYYGDGNYRPVASRSEVIEDAVLLVSEKLGIN